MKTLFILTLFTFFLVGCSGRKVKEFKSEGPMNFTIKTQLDSSWTLMTGFFNSKKLLLHFWQDLPGCRYRDLGVLWIGEEQIQKIALPKKSQITFFTNVIRTGFMASSRDERTGPDFRLEVDSSSDYELEVLEDDGSSTMNVFQVKGGKRIELENINSSCQKWEEVH